MSKFRIVYEASAFPYKVERYDGYNWLFLDCCLTYLGARYTVWKLRRQLPLEGLKWESST